MEVPLSFGRWLKRRRVELELTQAELAQRIGYALVTVRKIESDDLRPSQQVAERLAEQLAVPVVDRDAFIRFARGGTEQAHFTRVGELPMELAVPARSEEPPPPHSRESLISVYSFPAAQDWGETPDITLFYGRQAELADLSMGRSYRAGTAHPARPYELDQFGRLQP